MQRKPLQRRRKRDPVDAEMAKRWWKLTVCRGGCIMCRAFPVSSELRAARLQDLRRIEGHHVLARRHLKAHGYHGRLWDTRNGLALCTYHHHRHEWGMQRVPYELVPDDALEFAAELELEWLIEREYPGGPT